jgi:hypothetical protein
MRVVFIITALISLLFAMGGMNIMDARVGVGIEAANSMRMGMGLGGLILSAALFFLCHHIYRMRKQLDALSAALLGADDSKPSKPPK